MVGVNRIVVGNAVPHPVGNPKLEDAAKEKSLRRKYVVAALQLLQKEVEGPTTAIIE